MKNTSKSTCSEQIIELDKIQNNLQELEKFVENQKKELKGLENVVTDLKSEKEELESIIKADKKLVQSLIGKTLAIQQEQYEREKLEINGLKEESFFLLGLFHLL